jgi:UPF0755 protein
MTKIPKIPKISQMPKMPKIAQITHFGEYSHLRWLLPLIIGIFLVFFMIYEFAATPVAAVANSEVNVTIKQGMTSDEIGQVLYDKGLFPSAMIFRLYARMYGLEHSLQAGDYLFDKDMTIRHMVDMMARGETASRTLLVPEGYTIDQIAQLVEKTKIGKAQMFKQLAVNYAPYDDMVSSADVTYKAEGYLFPATYQFSSGVTEQQVLDAMTTQFHNRFTPEMVSRAAEEGLSVRQVVILASLVEKEAQKEADRSVIAGVFLNRLRQAMPLQSCATIQYILGYPKAELSVQDTELPSPYNTYQHNGLPPGPIANPGMASIMAVLYPAQTDYLYFVADKQGAHHFSKTYEEHLLAIQQVTQ